MRKRLLAVFIVCAVPILSFSQSISIDGRFNDWAGIATYTDGAADGNGVDLKGFSVTNDEKNLYIRLITNAEFNLSDSNNLYMNIDADNNPATGFSTNGIGSEFAWRFGSKYGFYYYGSNRDTVYAAQLGMAGLTTHKNDTFEIAISRSAKVGALLQSLFTKDTIKINFVNGVTGGDQMPNQGSTRFYVFNNQLVSDFAPIELSKCNSNYLRIMTYNTAFDGLIDVSRTEQFRRIMQVVTPDIIVFNECGNTTYQQAKAKLDAWLPLSSGSWYCYKVDPGNIICSRFPVKYAKNISFRKTTVAYIDLPSVYATDFLFIGTHLMYYNDGDSTRQKEADIIAAYLRDMKAGTTEYKIPANTPFAIAGDFNLVNSYSPLNTILTGEIVHHDLYGSSDAPDWNGQPISSVYAKVSERDMAYTWRSRDAKARWLPGKLDYIVHSNVNLEVKKSFVLQSELMSEKRLQQYGLEASDTYLASDHLPVVVDIELPTITALTTNVQWNGQVNNAWENAANWDCGIVPGKNSNVIIPAVAPHYPEVNANTEIHSLFLQNNSTVNFKQGVQFLINGQ
ncbi:MAG: endonuclease/exonuclease/phosphatase family protein [Ferruginibacter sp.]